MNELELVSAIVPAKADFNYDAIDKQLDIILLKYRGLIFTENDISDCKKTLAELRKSKKELNDFKIETKKTLNKAVDDFEAKCKKLDDKIVLVIDPISKQAAEFEVTRKEDKTVEIQDTINSLIIAKGIEPKYSVELVVTDHMLNKGTTMKAITEDLTNQASKLLLNQEIEQRDIELIKSKVEVVNNECKVLLLDTTYLNLMTSEPVESIIIQIYKDGDLLQAKREAIELENKVKTERQEAARLIEVERQKKEAELKEAARLKEVERQAEVEANREIEKAKQLEIKIQEEKEAEALQETFKAAAAEVATIKAANIEKAKESQEVEDFSKVEVKEIEEPEILYFADFRIYGSIAEIEAVKKYFKDNNVENDMQDQGEL